MSMRRQNLSFFVDDASPSSKANLPTNRNRIIVEMPDFGSYEITKENVASRHDGPATGNSFQCQKTPSGSLLTFQGSHINGLAEKYEHPEHVPVFLDFDEKSGSLRHMDRQEGRNRLDNTRRKGSLLPDDEYEAIRMTFPSRTRGAQESSPKKSVGKVPAVVLTPPPPQATSRSRLRSEGHGSPRPRGPRVPNRVASSAQLRVTPAPPSVRQRTKSAANRLELLPLEPIPPVPVTPQFNGAVADSSQNVLRDNRWEGVYGRNDAVVSKTKETTKDTKDPTIKGKFRSLFKKSS